MWAASRRSVDEGPDRGDCFFQPSGLRSLEVGPGGLETVQSHSHRWEGRGNSRLERVRRLAGLEPETVILAVMQTWP